LELVSNLENPGNLILNVWEVWLFDPNQMVITLGEIMN